MSVFVLAYALWCGAWWRLRGGALTALTGFDPGTGGMRAIAAVAIAAPLLAFGWAWALMIPALWVGWSLAGWGAFQGMGVSPVEMKNPVAALLSRYLKGTWLCIVGMAAEGIYCLLWVSIIAAVISGAHFVGLAGVGFAPCYWVAQKSPWRPNAGRFARGGSEWGEVLVGLWVGLVLALAV